MSKTKVENFEWHWMFRFLACFIYWSESSWNVGYRRRFWYRNLVSVMGGVGGPGPMTCPWFRPWLTESISLPRFVLQVSWKFVGMFLRYSAATFTKTNLIMARKMLSQRGNDELRCVQSRNARSARRGKHVRPDATSETSVTFYTSTDGVCVYRERKQAVLSQHVETCDSRVCVCTYPCIRSVF